MDSILPPLHRAMLLYFLLLFTFRAFVPPGMFLPDGRPRCLGLGDDETLFPVWLAAAAFAVLL